MKSRIIDILNSVEQKGFRLNSLAKAGILSSKVISYREIYLEFAKNKEVYKLGTMDAARKTCDELNVSELRVFRAKRLMEKSE